MAFQFTNNATTTLASSITAASTTITVASGTGSLFPVPTGTDFFHATLADTAGNTEIVRVTSRATDSFTVLRAQEGTTARNFSAGDRVELRVTAGILNSVAYNDSPTFTGTPKAPTAVTADTTNQIATTAFVAARVGQDAPTKTGSGASGTWNINIAGNAATADSAQNAISAVTQPAKTANNTIATTAFVDALRSLSASTATGTLTTADRGAFVKVSADITIPSLVFAANDTFTIYNTSAATVNIVAGTGLTLYFAGSTLTGSRGDRKSVV